MEIGINLFCCDTDKKLNLDKKINLMAENDFYHTFTRSDDVQLTNDTVRRLRDKNIIFDFLHLPFNGINALYSNGEEAQSMLELLFDGIEKCSRYEIPLAVVHLSSGKCPPFNDIGAERYESLIEKARKLGVKIAFENLRTLGNISLMLERYNDSLFCWDTGHESCFTPGRRYMPLFKSRLAALHLHDNRGIYDKDEHMLPYDGNIDFLSVAKQLAEINFDGTLMLEVVKSRSSLYDKLSEEEYYKRASASAKKLLNAIEDLKAT